MNNNIIHIAHNPTMKDHKTSAVVPIVIGNHIFLASGFHFHINNQTDAGERSTMRVSHIGVGADMDQVIETLINPKPHNHRGLSTFQQPHNIIIKMN